jgi:prefoldin subunit 5
MSNKVTRALHRLRGDQAEIAALRAEVRQLRSAVEESRRLNERLSDVLDVVVELLVPAVDRNEERLAESLRKL